MCWWGLRVNLMTFSVKTQNEIANALSVLVDDVLTEDPIDWGLLSISEEEAKNTIVYSMVEHYSALRDRCGDSRDDVDLSLLAMATKLALENFALHAR